MTRILMSYIEARQWPSFSSFLLLWIGTSLLTWLLVCCLGLVFMSGILDAGLVPKEILLALAFIPILPITLLVQTVLFVAGKGIRHGDPQAHKCFMVLATPLVTWICLGVITWIVGGPDAFVPRM